MDHPAPPMNKQRNLVLIGMPGCGKSSTGVLLAKSLCLDFLDTDLLIQKREAQSLQRLIDQQGMDHFLCCERAAILSIDPQIEQTVIATGGSVVLSEKAMQHLRRLGLVIFLDVPLDKLQRRLRNIHTRGIAMKPGQSLADIYRDRQPRYKAFADRTVQGGRGSLEKMVEYLIRRLQQEGFMPCQPEQLSQPRQPVGSDESVHSKHPRQPSGSGQPVRDAPAGKRKRHPNNNQTRQGDQHENH